MTRYFVFKNWFAKEVLVFFVIVGMISLAWIFFISRNFYFDSLVKLNQEKTVHIDNKLDSLPPDKIEFLYEGINSEFVLNYIVNNKKFSILKKEESKFLKDYPSAKLIEPTKLGYSYFKMDISKVLNKDSLLVFDYVDLLTFRKLIQQDHYKDNFYKTFSAEYELGTKESFDSKIETGLYITEDILLQRTRLLDQRKLVQEDLNSSKLKVKSNNQILNILLWFACILTITIYSFRLIRWALKTIKNATKHRVQNMPG